MFTNIIIYALINTQTQTRTHTHNTRHKFKVELWDCQNENGTTQNGLRKS